MLAGCSVGPDYAPDAMPTPPAWTHAGEKTRAAGVEDLRAWWKSFDDPMLDRLVDQAIAGNDDLKMARQRLVQARADRAIAASVDYPQIEATAGRYRSNASRTVDYPIGFGQYTTWEAGFDASWEIDVFGGTRRSVEAAEAEIGASVQDRRAVLVSVLSELASEYAHLRASQQRLAIAEKNEADTHHAFDLTERKFKRGFASELSLAQARAEWESVAAQVPQLRSAVAQACHAIALLVGSFPEEIEAELSKPAPLMAVPATLPVTMPSEVVANRPDVREAERHYAAANARIGVAVANLLPHFSIPLTFEPTSSATRTLFYAKSVDWSVGIAIQGTVFDGGRNNAELVKARAAAETAKVAYEKTVRSAFRDVEDALVAFRGETERQERLTAAASDSDLSRDRAAKLFASGITDFFQLQVAERDAYAAEDLAALSREAEIQDVIALYKALGGGWQEVGFDDAATE
jgi:NodT family efflux transporter outer membrane factor (OMF) lipoprotein